MVLMTGRPPDKPSCLNAEYCQWLCEHPNKSENGDNVPMSMNIYSDLSVSALKMQKSKQCATM